MAKRGRIQKTDPVGHRSSDHITILQGSTELTYEKPKPYDRWLKITKERWDNYWASDLAKMTQIVDLAVVERLHQYYDQIERCNRVIRQNGSKEMISVGSKGQPRISPVIELVLKTEEKVLKLENELGLTPLSRQRLGIAHSEAALSITELQKQLADVWDDYEDPRMIEVRNEEE